MLLISVTMETCHENGVGRVVVVVSGGGGGGGGVCVCVCVCVWWGECWRDWCRSILLVDRVGGSVRVSMKPAIYRWEHLSTK